MKKILNVFLIVFILQLFLPAGRVFAAGTAKVSVETDVLGCGDLIAPTEIPADGTGRASEALLRLLADHGYTCFYGGAPENAFYLAYIADGDKTGSYNGYKSSAQLYPPAAPKKLKIRTNIAPKLKAYLTANTSFFDETDYEMNSPGYLGEFVYTNESGWMYCLNGDFTQKDLGSVYLRPGDELRLQFTLCLGLDLGGNADAAAQAAFNAAVGDPATDPATTRAATTARAPAHPAFTVPAMTRPATTRPATTQPATTQPPTTAQPAATQPPATTQPPAATAPRTTMAATTTTQQTSPPTTVASAQQTTAAAPATDGTAAPTAVPPQPESTAIPESAAHPVTEEPATAAPAQETTAAPPQLSEPAPPEVSPAEKKHKYWIIPATAAVPVTAMTVIIIVKKIKEKKETP